MEQLEIDWKYSDAMQAADNENQVKYVVRDIFTRYAWIVIFMAKPFEGDRRQRQSIPIWGWQPS